MPTQGHGPVDQYRLQTMHQLMEEGTEMSLKSELICCPGETPFDYLAVFVPPSLPFWQIGTPLFDPWQTQLPLQNASWTVSS